MAKKTKAQQAAEDAAKEAIRLLEREAEIRAQMNSSYDDYIEAVKKARALQETLTKNREIEKDIQDAVNSGKRNGVKLTKKEIAVEKEKLKIIQSQNDKIEAQVKLYKSAAKEVNVGAMAAGKAFNKLGQAAFKNFVDLPNMVKRAWGELKGLGLFELDKAIKQSALSMGVLSKEGAFYRKNLKDAAAVTNSLGVDVKALAELQSSYSENLGRTVILSKEGAIGMAEMSKMTGLGAEGAAKMAADMDLQGLSAERTAGFVQETLDASSKMGLNATKVLKNVAGGIKLMDKYRFKEGTKGLAKMAQLVTRLGVDMNSVSGMAEKLFNIEGAVEMSAQLNVMGGAFAAMSDPFHLMFMARNDMQGLTEEIAKASQESISFNNATGEFDMSAEGMHRLRIIAEQTGVAYEDLVTMGKNMAKFEKVKTQVGFSIGGSDEDKAMLDYISNKSSIGKDGKAEIFIGGSRKLVSQLTSSDKKLIQSQIAQEETMRKRIEDSQSFDEQLTYFIADLKLALLPMIEAFNKPGGLSDSLKDFVKKFNEPGGWKETIQLWAGKIGDFISSVGGWIIEHPKLTAAIWAFSKAAPLIVGAIKLFGGIWDTIKWFKNGIALANGFNSAVSMGGGGGGADGDVPDFGSSSRRGSTSAAAKSRYARRYGKMATARRFGGLGKYGKGLKWGGRALGVAGLGLDAYNQYQSNQESGMGTGENVGKTATSTAAKGVGAWAGAKGGAAAGAAIGALFGGVGAVPGAFIGGLLGGIGGYFVGDKVGEGINSTWGKQSTEDAFFGAPVKDGLFESDFKKGLSSSIKKQGQQIKGKNMSSSLSNARGIIQGGKITPIDTRDDVLALKKGGAIDKFSGAVGGETTVKHKFDSINISGKLTVEIPGGASHDLLADQSFRRAITRAIQEETVKQMNQGKPKG